jgi:hypothetical protein
VRRGPDASASAGAGAGAVVAAGTARGAGRERAGGRARGRGTRGGHAVLEPDGVAADRDTGRRGWARARAGAAHGRAPLAVGSHGHEAP